MLFVTKQTVSKWETGRSLPDLETTQKLIEILQIDPNLILGGTVQEVRKNRKLLNVATALSIITSLLLCFLVGGYFIRSALIENGYGDKINAPNQFATDVTMIELIAAPEKYDGKLIRVIGIGNLEFENDCIALSSDDLKYHIGNKIWIELGERAISYEEAKEYNGKYVIVEGFFDKNDCGHFDQFQGSVKNVSRYQLWETDWDTE